MENISTDDKLVTDFTDAVSKADNLRLEGLQTAEDILNCNYNALLQQRDWLAAKHGVDYSLTKKADSELLFWPKFSAAIDAETGQSKIKPDAFEMTDWRIHGRAFDKNNMPVKDVSVSLTEEKKEAAVVIQQVKTDENGYYSITLDEKVVKELNGRSMALSLSDNKRKVSAGTFALISGTWEY